MRWTGTRMMLTAAVIATVVTAGGCGRRLEMPLYSHFEQVGQQGWTPGDALVFVPAPADTTVTVTTPARLEAVVRWSSRMPVPRFIPIAVNYMDSEGVETHDTLRIGAGIPGTTVVRDYGITELHATLKTRYRPDPGATVTLTQLTAHPLKGPVNVGLLLTINDK